MQPPPSVCASRLTFCMLAVRGRSPFPSRGAGGAPAPRLGWTGVAISDGVLMAGRGASAAIASPGRSGLAEDGSPEQGTEDDERGRLLRKAVATVVEALGDHGVAYRRNLQAWIAGYRPAARTIAALPASVKMAGARLPASPKSLRAAHKELVRSVDQLRKDFRVDVRVRPARPRSLKHASLSSMVCASPPGPDWPHRAYYASFAS